MRDTALDRKMKLLILAGSIGALLLASAVFGGRNKPAAKTGSTAGRGAYATGPVTTTTESTSGITKLEFMTQPKELMPGEPAIWMPKIFDTKTNKSVRSYETVRDHMMHLIVVSKNLLWFAHLFPEYKDHGLFITRTAVPFAGTYKLYASYTPRDGTPEVAQRELSVGSTPAGSATPSPLVADTVGEDGWIIGHVGAGPESPPLGGDIREFEEVAAPPSAVHYQVAIRTHPTKLVASHPATLRFQVRDSRGKPLADLEPYLGAMGYAVIISSDTNSYVPAQPKQMVPEDIKPDDAVVVFHTRFPTAGLYKIWGQFKRGGKIMTAPFVVRVAAGSSEATTTKQAA